MRRAVMLAIAAFILLVGASPGSSFLTPRSRAATPTLSPTPTTIPTTSAVPAPGGSPRPPLPPLSSLPPCPTPGPYNGVRPPHPPQPGDSFCDAGRFAVKSPTLKAPARVGRRQSSSDPQYNVAVAASGNVAYYGIYAGRQVTAVSVGPTDTLYFTMHTGYSTDPNWAEVGWMFQGSGLASCAPGQYMVYTASRYTFDCFPKFPVGPGGIIWVYAESDGVSTWYQWIWWNGAWQCLCPGIYEGFAATTHPNVIDEAVANPDLPAYPETNVYDAELFQYAGQWEWVAWGGNIPGSQAWYDAPYFQNMLSYYDNWNRCGPVGPPTYTC